LEFANARTVAVPNNVPIFAPPPRRDSIKVMANSP
jgi:hypothetical protein